MPKGVDDADPCTAGRLIQCFAKRRIHGQSRNALQSVAGHVRHLFIGEKPRKNGNLFFRADEG